MENLTLRKNKSTKLLASELDHNFESIQSAVTTLEQATNNLNSRLQVTESELANVELALTNLVG